MSLKLIFMGTPAFAVPVLEALHKAGHSIARVYSQPPRESGRGMELRKSPVQMKAEELGLEVLHPATLKEQAQSFAALQADGAIVVAYGLLLPQSILEGVKYGCFNLHPSLLPRWRGAAPLQRAIMAGDAQTGIAVMRMQAGLDTGPICMEQTYPLSDAITAQELHDALSREGAAMMVQAMTRLQAGSLTCTPQNDAGITYAEKITKAEAKIDFTKPARAVLRHIHGLSPFPGAWTLIHGHRVKILKAELAENSGAPAHVLDDDLTIACGHHAIRPLLVQREGKQATPRDAFLRGLAVAAGTELT